MLRRPTLIFINLTWKNIPTNIDITIVKTIKTYYHYSVRLGISMEERSTQVVVPNVLKTNILNKK